MSPALTDLPVRDVTRALRAAGFERVRVKGSHAVYPRRRRQGGRGPEHGTIKRGTLASIVRHAGLSTAEYLELLD